MRKIRVQSAVHNIKAKAAWLCIECGREGTTNTMTCPCGGQIQRFASRREAKRWKELKLLERAGQIANLRRQVRFTLVPKEYTMSGRARTYTADFVYEENGRTVIEDAKGGAATREAMLRLDVLRMVLVQQGVEAEVRIT